MRAAAGGGGAAGAAGGSTGSGGPSQGGPVRATKEARALEAAASVARACRAVGRLVARVTASPLAAPVAAASPAGGEEDVGVAAVALLAREHGLRAPAGADGPQRAGEDDDPPVAAGIGGLAPADVSVLGALAIGMLLLAVTALAGYALADGHAASRRRRSLLQGARAARHDPARRADALAVLVLVVASLAFWSGVALWLVLGAR